MTRFSDLSWDLVEEILSRVPITCLGRVRSTCKAWNDLCKDQSFTKKHCGKATKEFLLNMTSGYSCMWNCVVNGILFPARVSLYNIKDLPSIKEISKMFCPVPILEVYQCDGLLICVTSIHYKLVVWNPYLAQTRWIDVVEPINVDGQSCIYAIGYDNNHDHKVLSLFHKPGEMVKHKIYDFKTNSWRVLDITNDCSLSKKSMSLNGNSYFIVKKTIGIGFVICFDFTTERFGPRINLPFHPDFFGDMVLSCVGEEQLAVLHHYGNRGELEIWITTKIESDAISWRKLFKVVMKPLADLLHLSIRSFFIDKKKKVAVVCGRCANKTHDLFFVVGEDGYYKEISCEGDMFPYVPSPVLIK